MNKFLFFLFLFFHQIVFSQNEKKIDLLSYRVSYLCDTLKETSGLTFVNHDLYTLNDGGNQAAIFKIDANTGKIIKSHFLKETNHDWEAITSKNQSLFIGDFGNNSGKRNNLIVHQFEIKNDSVELIKSVPFQYQNQTDYNAKPHQTNFDCEAMVFDDNKLHLFTKEWENKGVSHYILDLETDLKQNVVPVEQFDTKFLVTDAAFFENRLYVIGYTRKGSCFLQIFEKVDTKYFAKVITKIHLGSALSIGQIEGIAVNENGIYISAEAFKKFVFNLKPILYFIPFKELSNFAE